jgi:hypothetical protein
MVKKKWWVRKIAQTSEMNGLVEKAKADRTIGLFLSNAYSPLHWELEPLGFSVVRGGWVIVFIRFHTPVTNIIGLRLQTTSYSSAWELAGSPVVRGRSYNFSSLYPIPGAHRFSKHSARKRRKVHKLSSVQSIWQCALWSGERTLTVEHSNLSALPVSYSESFPLCANARLFFLLYAQPDKVKVGRILRLICEPSF